MTMRRPSSRAFAESLERRVLLTAGQLDTTFGAGGIVTTPAGENSGGVDAALQPDGRIVVVASVGYDGNPPGFELLRYNPDGSPDGIFGNGGRAPAPPTMAGWTPYAMALAPDGRIVVGGTRVSHPNASTYDFDFALARFNSDGSLDPSFGNGGTVIFDWSDYSRVHDVAVQPDGKIVASGWDTWVRDDLTVVRLNVDGTLDAGFGDGGISRTDFFGFSDYTYGVALAPGGKVVVAGVASVGGPDVALAVARLNPDGTPDATFDGDGKVALGIFISRPWAVHAYDDGRILLGGESAIARLLPDGRPDPTFAGTGVRTGIGGTVYNLAVEPTGKILTTTGNDNFPTSRFTPSGQFDPTWGRFGGYVTTSIPGTPDGPDYTRAVLVQPDSKVISVGSANANAIALVRYQGDRSPPGVSASRFVADPRQEIRLEFSEPVGTVDLDDLHVIDLATGQRVPYTQFFVNSQANTNGTFNATWIPVTPLAGGDYRALLPADSVRNANGVPNDEFSFTFTVSADDVIRPFATSYGFYPSPRQEIRFIFSEDVLGSLDLDDLLLTDRRTGQAVGIGGFFLNARGGANVPTEATWASSLNDLPAGNYRATLAAGNVADAAGNTMAADVAFDFTVGDPAPYVTSAQYTTYFGGQGKQVELFFSEGMRETEVDSSDLIVTNRATGEVMRGVRRTGTTGGPSGITRVGWGGQNILPTGDYRATLPADAIHDQTGNPMAADFHFDFTVGPQPDNAGPTLVRSAFMDWPAPRQRLQFEFNEWVVSGVDADALGVTNLDTGQALPASAFTGGAWTETITQWQSVQPLPAGRYRATVRAGAVRDAWGNALASDAVLEFQVVGPGDNTPPAIVSAAYSDSPQQVELKFSEDVYRSIDYSDVRVVNLMTGEEETYHGLNYGGGDNIPTTARWQANRPLGPGPYRLTIPAGAIADPSGNALPAFAFEFTVPRTDFTAPLVTSKSFSPGLRPYVEYAFSEDVSRSIDPSDLRLTNTTTGQPVDTSGFTLYQFYRNNWATVAQWSAPGLLPPGEYVATLNAAGIADLSGNTLGDAAASRLAFRVDPPAPAVVGRHLFYNNSAFDGRDFAADARDDAAIASDKQALVERAGQAWSPTFANVSSFAKGITGVMVDVVGLPADATLFGIFRLQAGTDPSAPGPMPEAPFGTFTRRAGAGVFGSDRVTITWRDGAIVNKWLRVNSFLNGTTERPTDVFSFGNLVGESGDGAGAGALRVNALDLAAAKRALGAGGAVPVTNPGDFDRDGRVNALDLAAVRRNLGATLVAPVAAPAPASAPGAALPSATDLLHEE